MSKITKDKLIKRAKKLFKRENYENCIKTANKILKMDSNYLEAYIFKLDSFIRLDKKINIDDFEETVLGYLTHSPKDEGNYLVAIYYIILMDKIELIDKLGLLTYIINEGMLSHPESYDILLLRLKVLYENSEFEETIEYLDNLAKTNKFWKDILYFKANIYMEEDKYDKSLEVYNKILNDSRDLDTLSRKIRTLQLIERDDEALEILDGMIDDNDEKNWALVNKGLHYQDQDETLAMEFIDEAIKNDPEYGFAYYGKASVLAQIDEYDDAAKYLDKALTYDVNLSDNADFIFLSAIICYHGDDDGIAALEHLSRIDFIDYCYYDTTDLLLEMFHDIISEGIFESDGTPNINIDGDFNFDKETMDLFKKSNVNAIHVIFYKNHDSHFVDTRIYNNPVDNNLSPEIIDMIESGEDVELYDDTPEKRDLTTVEDYEQALSDFHDLKGDEYFKEHKGRFWKLHETRPFMMWLFDYSALLWDEEIDKDKSIDLLKYMIELNPSDNQGARDILMTRLLELDRLKEFKEYNLEYDDYGSFTLYNNVLLAIKNKKNDAKIKSLLKKAIEFNEHVITYLTNKKPIPQTLPEVYSYGGLDEAEYYVIIAIKAWNNDEIAMKKLNEYIQSLKRDFY
ncbi:MAG: hypothetical protein LBT10_08800 [Methanobrevibacter sp.]|jgi:tetratricopeptide (TPR) repeat protein|nr:hypothetical protein [Methanobrevibacter sp.]